MAQQRKPLGPKNKAQQKPNIAGKKELVDKEQQEWLNAKLREAADDNDMGMAKMLIKDGADVNSPKGSGWTPLMLAAKGGYTGMCHLLIENGAKIDVKNIYGNDAIIIAKDNGHVATAEFLKIMAGMGKDGMVFLKKLEECRQSVKAIAE